MAAHVAELTYYPVKGCAGATPSEAWMTPAGLAHDRSFMVVDDEGVFRTQRRDPRLAVIRPAVGEDGTRLTLGAPDTEPLTLPVDTSGARRRVELFGTAFRGIDQGDAVAEWLSEVLGAPSRLVRVPPEHDRVTDGRVPGTSGYADSSAVHVISRSTLAHLDRRLTETGTPPIPMSRFRPNVVISGWPEPHTEDRAHRLTIGTTDLAYAKVAIRCAVVLVDQRTGHRPGPEPLRTLARYRRAPGGGVAFGTKYAVLRPGRLAVGDAVTVTAWGEPEVEAPERVPGGRQGA